MVDLLFVCLPLVIVVLNAILDYKSYDKRTIQFKKNRNILYIVIVCMVVVSLLKYKLDINNLSQANLRNQLDSLNSYIENEHTKLFGEFENRYKAISLYSQIVKDAKESELEHRQKELSKAEFYYLEYLFFAKQSVITLKNYDLKLSKWKRKFCLEEYINQFEQSVNSVDIRKRAIVNGREIIVTNYNSVLEAEEKLAKLKECLSSEIIKIGQ